MIHALARRARTRQFMADIRITDIFHRPVQLLERTKQHFALGESRTKVVRPVDDEERRTDLVDIGERRFVIQQLLGRWIPGKSTEGVFDQAVRVTFAIERRELVETAL